MENLAIKVINNRDSIDYILKNRVSVARFGDGEMDIIAGASIPYQDYHSNLAEQMTEILAYQSDKDFLVCLPDVFEDLERYNQYAVDFWRGHLSHYEKLYQETCKASWYGSTFISRPYIDLKDKSTITNYFEQLKQLWDKQDVLIVEGETSRSGVGNDLFENANSLQRIICPSKNAFSSYDWIADQIRQYGKDKLILLMLGPTAKVLAFNLSKEGYHLIDLGHIDSEYEWYKMGATHKVKLNHKHTAEHNYDENLELLKDCSYEQSIVAKFNQVKETIPVAFAVNENYAQYVGATVLSLLATNPQSHFTIYVLYKELSDETLAKLNHLNLMSQQVSVTCMQVTISEMYGIPIRTEQFPFESFFRFALPNLLPNWDKVLYFDVDILIKKDISELWHTDLGDFYIAAVRERDIYAYYQWYLESLGFSAADDYFSSGILLMNLKKMREDTISEKLIAIAQKDAENLKFPDQDILNQFFKNNVLLLDSRYNYTDRCKIDQLIPAEEVVIEHFNGDHKAWHSLAKLPAYLKTSALTYQMYQQEFSQYIQPMKSISIVVLVKHFGLRLEESLEHLLGQTYSNLDIVVVNATKLNMLENIQSSYLMSSRNIQFFSETHSSEQEAIAFAVNKTHSENIIFVDATDIPTETMVEKLIVEKQKYATDIVVGDYYVYNEQDGCFYFHNQPDDVSKVLTSESATEYYEQWHQEAIPFKELSGKLVSRKLFSHFDTSQPIFPQLYQLTKEVVFLNSNIYLKRVLKEELISVIVPVYNAEKYLTQCLDSILSQTYRNLEIIVVIDGATDSSSQICENYAQKDERIKLIYQENQGSAQAKNTGIKNATAEYLTIVDADDILLEDAIQTLYQSLVANQSDISIINFFKYDEDRGEFAYYVLDKDLVIEQLSPQEAVNRQIAWHLNTTVFIVPWGKLYKKELFNHVIYPLGRYFDDEATTHRLYMNSEKITFINGNYYMYRIHGDSQMNSFQLKQRIRDLLYMTDIKITDLVLAGFDTRDMQQRVWNLLNWYKQIIEQHHLTEMDEYQLICYRLEKLERRGSVH